MTFCDNKSLEWCMDST